MTEFSGTKVVKLVKLSINLGVPQGSVQRLNRFTLYVNDFGDCFDVGGEAMLSANDTTTINNITILTIYKPNWR